MSTSTLYLIDAHDEVDESILRKWVADHGGALDDVVAAPHPRAEDAAQRIEPLARRLTAADDVLLAPLRVAWLPEERDGERTVQVRDLLQGDPRNPTPRRKRRILTERPDRALVVVGESALLSEVRTRQGPAVDDDANELATFVARQALLALERAEYRVRGARYKVPRLVREELMASPTFRRDAARLADELGRDSDEVWNDVVDCLDEMVTGYSRLFLDLMARIGKRLTRPGYGDVIDYDPQQLERVRKVLSEHPAVILPSHKSNLDALVIPVALHENGLPPTHTFAGINMAFWPFGNLYRRAGRIFIRRDTKGDPVYRWVLRQYLGYLVEKRFTLEWYIEGTRSRTGKLAPPKMGLLRYIADACREGRTDDVAMIPVSIMYDQLHEVGEFASEAVGSTKKAEGLGWLVKFVKSQHGHFGRIYVRFAEPISLRAAIEDRVSSEGLDMENANDDLPLQKLAFEVCTRINSVTPITASALICLVLLATRGRALSARELHLSITRLLGQVNARRLPLAESAKRLDTEDGVRGTVGALAANGTIEVYDEGDEPVYMVGRDHYLAASFYRNTIVHFFVEGSIAELALVHAGESGADDPVEAFWQEAEHLRDLLKFDFFFEQRDAFRASLTNELQGRLAGWDEQLAAAVEPVVLLDKMQPLHAFAVLRPFVEAYLIVAWALLSEPTDEAVDRKALSKRCLALGGQFVRQERVRSPEAVSKHLFEAALRLAEHRRLTAPDSEVAERRRQFADELDDVARRIDIIEQRTYDASGRSLT